MYIFYCLSIIPLLIGFVLWLFCDKVLWWEWIVNFSVALLLAILFHLSVFYGKTTDYETWSGEITTVFHYPEWVERYEVTVTEYNSKGEAVGSHEETHYRTHHEYWKAYTNINSSREIGENFYNEIVGKFGGKVYSKWAYKSGFYSGDHDHYFTNNETGYIYPITECLSFENRIKASPTLFSFSPVPKNAIVYEYPDNNEWIQSNRLVGTSSNDINLYNFDKFNSRLGPAKKVNVIMVGFPDGTGEINANYQQSKWLGGKKNDIVICYSHNKAGKVQWVYVFGWTEKELCKQNLQTMVLNNKVNDSILPLLESEIRNNYTLKDWHRFDYITISPSSFDIWLFIIIMLIVEAGLWIFFIINYDSLKDSDSYRTGLLRRFR